MSKPYTVLLDLDGTLIDSRPGIAASCLAALRALGHSPDETLDITAFIGAEALMVGDRRHDIVGAHAVRMRGLGVLWGYGSRDELEAAGADHVVEHTADLARTVRSMLES